MNWPCPAICVKWSSSVIKLFPFHTKAFVQHSKSRPGCDTWDARMDLSGSRQRLLVLLYIIWSSILSGCLHWTGDDDNDDDDDDDDDDDYESYPTMMNIPNKRSLELGYGNTYLYYIFYCVHQEPQLSRQCQLPAPVSSAPFGQACQGGVFGPAATSSFLLIMIMTFCSIFSRLPFIEFSCVSELFMCAMMYTLLSCWLARLSMGGVAESQAMKALSTHWKRMANSQPKTTRLLPRGQEKRLETSIHTG